MSVSSVADLESASLSFSSLSGWAKLGLRDRFIELTDAVWRVRGYGDFLSYCLLAEGAVDIAAEPEVSLWDLAALDIVVREAGGAFTRPRRHPGAARRQRRGHQRAAARGRSGPLLSGLTSTCHVESPSLPVHPMSDAPSLGQQGVGGEGSYVQQLSWTDDMMLRAERPETPMQIQMLLIYDPATAPGGRVTYKGILEEIDARLHLAPTFRRRLTELPGGLHMPYWVDDPDFDLEYHVRHIALPQPGDWRQLCIQIARIHARQIDLRRPPWEMTVIEGLNSVPGVPQGAFAIGLKLHHSVVDGMESVELMAAMHDLTPDGPRPNPPETPWEPGPLPSTASSCHGLRSTVRSTRCAQAG